MQGTSQLDRHHGTGHHRPAAASSIFPQRQRKRNSDGQRLLSGKEFDDVVFTVVRKHWASPEEPTHAAILRPSNYSPDALCDAIWAY